MSFAEFDHSPANVEACFSSMSRPDGIKAAPSPQRRPAVATAREHVLHSTPALLDEARALYADASHLALT